MFIAGTDPCGVVTIGVLPLMALPSPPYLHECFSYDPETGSLTWKARQLHHFKRVYDQNAWNAQWAGKPAGSRGSRYYVVTIGYRTFLAHRVIFAMRTGMWPKQIDHVNRNGFDNRWDNLREATVQQNKWNRSRPKRELPRGVRKSRKGPRFTAQVKLDHKTIHLGSYDTPGEAHEAWLAAVRRERGEFFRAD
jgi:hypothetical protein